MEVEQPRLLGHHPPKPVIDFCNSTAHLWYEFGEVVKPLNLYLPPLNIGKGYTSGPVGPLGDILPWKWTRLKTSQTFSETADTEEVKTFRWPGNLWLKAFPDAPKCTSCPNKAFGISEAKGVSHSDRQPRFSRLDVLIPGRATLRLFYLGRVKMAWAKESSID